MPLKDYNLHERVTKVETEVVVLTDIAKRIPEEIFHLQKAIFGVRDELREEFGRRFDQLDQRMDRIEHRVDRLDSKMEKVVWWLIGVMLALFLASLFKH